MNNYSKKKCAIGLLFLTSLLSACHDILDEGDSTRSVCISFKVPVATVASSQANSANDMSALMFKRTQSQDLEIVKYIPVAATWFPSQDNSYQMQCQLETGTYHFSLSKGLSLVDSSVEGNQGEQCYWIIDNNSYASIDEYAISHPINDDKTLKECKTELYLNTDDVRTAQQIYSNKSGEIKLFHAQARLDMVFIYEGDDADISPFASIDAIELELDGLNSSCRFSGESIESAERKAKFCQQLDENDFSLFNWEDYKKEFQTLNGLPAKDLTGENQKRIKKWYFFPASSIDGKLKVVFKNGYSQDFELSGLRLQRNWVTLIVINVIKEHLLLSPDGIGSAPLGDGGESESGFWN